MPSHKKELDPGKRSSYQSSKKKMAPGCNHLGMMPWDNHMFCLSCSVWKQKGQVVKQLDDGYIRLPCVFPPYCKVCEGWEDDKRSHYLKLVINRCLKPNSFAPGTRFVEEFGVAAPVPLLEALEIAVKEVTPSQSEEVLDSDPDSILDFTPEESGKESEEQGSRTPKADQGTQPGGQGHEAGSGSPESQTDAELKRLQASVLILKQNVQQMEEHIVNESQNKPQESDKGSGLGGDIQVSKADNTRESSTETSKKLPSIQKQDQVKPGGVMDQNTSKDSKSRGSPTIRLGQSRYAMSAADPPRKTSPVKSSKARHCSPPKVKRGRSRTRKSLESPKSSRNSRRYVDSSEDSRDSSSPKVTRGKSVGVKNIKRTRNSSTESDSQSMSKLRRSPRKKPSRAKAKSLRVLETDSDSDNHSTHSKKKARKSSGVKQSTETERIMDAVERVAQLLRSKSSVSKQSTSFKGKGKKRKLMVTDDSDVDIQQYSSPEDISRPTSSASSVIVSKEQVEELVQKLFKKNKIRVEDSEDEDEDRDVPNRRELLAKFKSVLQETIPDIPQCQSKEKYHRTSDLDMTAKKLPTCLPVHPTVKDTLDLCMSSVKEDSQGEPMGTGKLLSTTRNFPKFMYDIGDLSKFPKPQKNTESDLLPAAKNAVLNLSDKDLQSQEQQLREMTTLWSQNMWAFQAMNMILNSDMEADEAFEKLSDVLNQQKAVAPLIQDRLSVLLSNTVLRRRDLILKQTPCNKMKEESIIDLRATSLTQEKLFVIDSDLRKKEESEKTSRELLTAIAKPVNLVVPGMGKAYQQRGNTRNQRQNYQKKDTDTTPPAFQQPEASTGFAGASNYKAQRGRAPFRGNRDNTRARGRGSRGSRGRGNRGRGRGNWTQ